MLCCLRLLINIYSINQFTSFPLSLHHTHKVTSLPSLLGRGKWVGLLGL